MAAVRSHRRQPRPAPALIDGHAQFRAWPSRPALAQRITTSTTRPKPYLLIDVDGVLNPSISNRQAERAGFVTKRTFDSAGWRYRVFLHRQHGAWLSAMSDRFELAWATTWEGIADREFGPILGLPSLPVASLNLRTHYSKVPGILDFVGDRPFAWLDDCEALALVAVPNLVVHVDDRVGLTLRNLAAARTWAKRLPR